LGFKVRDLRFRVQGWGFGVEGSWFGAEGLTWSLRERVEGSFASSAFISCVDGSGVYGSGVYGSGISGFRAPTRWSSRASFFRIFEGNVTRFAPHNALKFIACIKVDFSEFL
jgi:hypothetical protein